jgi:hypothetical protein
MTTIVLEGKTVELLKNCTTATLLRDSHGNVIGFFEPPRRLVEPGETPQIDEAELDRRSQRWQGIPHQEARRLLENER